MSGRICKICGTLMYEAEGAIPSPGSLDVTSSGKYWICPKCRIAIKKQ
jgi:rubrerythrin